MNIDIKKFLDYILRQKKYSLNTYKNYEIDIMEFFSYLKEEKKIIKMFPMIL